MQIPILATISGAIHPPLLELPVGICRRAEAPSASLYSRFSFCALTFAIRPLFTWRQKVYPSGPTFNWPATLFFSIHRVHFARPLRVRLLTSCWRRKSDPGARLRAARPLSRGWWSAPNSAWTTQKHFDTCTPAACQGWSQPPPYRAHIEPSDAAHVYNFNKKYWNAKWFFLIMSSVGQNTWRRQTARTISILFSQEGENRSWMSRSPTSPRNSLFHL